MEQKRISVDTALLLEQYRELLQTAQTLPLVATGNSMVPFLADRRDTVYLSRIERPLRRGDIVLYQRESGAYILHRIYAVGPDGYDMVGDAQTQIEHGIRRGQIFAVVTAADRKGRRQEPGCFCWDFFEKVWIRMPALRPAAMRIYGAVRSVFWRKS